MPNDLVVRKRPQLFTKGHTRAPTSGRKKGTQNKTTTILKEAIILAAALHGSDGNGTDQLVGYLLNAAEKFPKQYLSLLGRVLPYQVNATIEDTERVYRTQEEVEAEMRRRGLPIPSNMFN